MVAQRELQYAIRYLIACCVDGPLAATVTHHVGMSVTNPGNAQKLPNRDTRCQAFRLCFILLRRGGRRSTPPWSDRSGRIPLKATRGRDFDEDEDTHKLVLSNLSPGDQCDASANHGGGAGTGRTDRGGRSGGSCPHDPGQSPAGGEHRSPLCQPGGFPSKTSSPRAISA